MIILKPSALVNFVKPSGDTEADTLFRIYWQGFAVHTVGSHLSSLCAGVEESFCDLFHILLSRLEW